MQKSLILALVSSSLCFSASAHPQNAPQAKVTRVNAEENSYLYHNYRKNAPMQAQERLVAARPTGASSYNRAYAHIIPPDGFQGTPSPYSLGPGWANRWGSYSSGTTAYPYNAGGFSNTGFFNGGFYPGGSTSYYR